MSRSGLGSGKGSGRAAQIGVGFLEMDRNRVMDDGLDVVRGEFSGDLVTIFLGDPSHEEVIDMMPGPCCDRRQHQAGAVGEGLAIPRGGGAAVFVPARELPYFTERMAA